VAVLATKCSKSSVKRRQTQQDTNERWQLPPRTSCLQLIMHYAN